MFVILSKKVEFYVKIGIKDFSLSTATGGVPAIGAKRPRIERKEAYS